MKKRYAQLTHYEHWIKRDGKWHHQGDIKPNELKSVTYQKDHSYKPRYQRLGGKK